MIENKMRCKYCGSREFEIKELFEIPILNADENRIDLKSSRTICVCAECNARLIIDFETTKIGPIR